MCKSIDPCDPNPHRYRNAELRINAFLSFMGLGRNLSEKRLFIFLKNLLMGRRDALAKFFVIFFLNLNLISFFKWPFTKFIFRFKYTGLEVTQGESFIFSLTSVYWFNRTLYVWRWRVLKKLTVFWRIDVVVFILIWAFLNLVSRPLVIRKHLSFERLSGDESPGCVEIGDVFGVFWVNAMLRLTQVVIKFSKLKTPYTIFYSIGNVCSFMASSSLSWASF